MNTFQRDRYSVLSRGRSHQSPIFLSAGRVCPRWWFRGIERDAFERDYDVLPLFFGLVCGSSSFRPRPAQFTNDHDDTGTPTIGMAIMADVESHLIRFQCPKCGYELEQSIGTLKLSERLVCAGCGIGINIDANKLSSAAEEMLKAIEKVPPEITIKFFR